MEEILVKAARAGIQFRADGDELRVTAPQGSLTEEIRQGLRLHKKQILNLLRERRSADEPLPLLSPDLANRYQPFALTDLQHAYWLGRESIMEMGNVATHLYVELDCDPLNLTRLNDALVQLIERHDMLRAIVNNDGQQQILPTVPRYEIKVTDRSRGLPEDAERTIQSTRDALSHQVLKADQWPLFEVRATVLPSERVRLHVSLDLLILDAWSIFLFFQEWHQLYRDGQKDLPQLGISFRDYVLAEKGLQQSEAYRRSHAYWMDRVDTLPSAPELPLRTDLTARQSPRFSRREARLPKAKWEKLKTAARSHGLTPSGLVLAAYAEVLARWSATPHFTLNVTVSNRLALHKDVNHLLGDFTSLVMQEVDLRDNQSTFLERARRLQQQFLADLDHREVSGVTVMREWAKRRGISLQAAMPVVFSSGLIWSGTEDVGDLEQFGKKIYSVSQTSQVWLDHHVMELNGDLVFIWDAADAVFEEGVLDAMFSSYNDLIERIADDASQWNSRSIAQLPDEMASRREKANQTSGAVIHRRIHSGFVANALKTPQAPAIFSHERVLSYDQLLRESCAVADWLIARGVRPGQPVAVVMHKGWEQIVAVFGILLAGGAYMPIDADLPIKRQRDLLQIGEVQQVLTQPGVSKDALVSTDWMLYEIAASAESDFKPSHAQSLERPIEELAYVIFTSGTTGVPKGVMIDHRGAVNTNEHINRLFRVGPEDRALAVSSLSFDLSVYDIFGLFDAGGALVIPDYRKGHDPIHWRELILEYGVTLWNSAPQLMRMLMDSFYPEEQETAAIRTVLLSGDFIPLDLPDRIRQRYQKADVVSLGGATEASIWSIYHPIGTVDPTWKSIPYGKPLPNQTIWVYDQALRPCPDFVKGKIYIGGTGLALGYWRDAEKTAARFIVHPQTGERLYDTGDLGRYAPDGNVIILGRDDGQIKIRGHRIELGEIEAVLRLYPTVKHAVVLPTAGARESRQLVAYLELHEAAVPVPEDVPLAPPTGQGLLDTRAIQEYLGEHLPDYMVPRHVIQLDRLPVSANGKIDYRALPVVSEEANATKTERILPRNEVEQLIFDTWSRVIVGCEIGVTDNFFELGGDSVLATQLVRELNAVLPVSLEMHELFENLTIESLAILIQSRTATDAGQKTEPSHPAPRTNGSVVDEATLFADVRAVVEGFSASNRAAKHSVSFNRRRTVLLTGGTGWLGSHALAELLSLTDSTIYCLVRAASEADGYKRLTQAFEQSGIEPSGWWKSRVRVLCGDLRVPAFGLDEERWSEISESVDAIYHLGASVNVLNDYAVHRETNVKSLSSLIQLSWEHHYKPVFYASPMAVCRRLIDGQVTVLPEEKIHPTPDGLLTGYSQSKWVAEQILLAASESGLQVKIYRTSHALPSARTGHGKTNDTYGAVLRVACEAKVIPEWPDSRMGGAPVNLLARLLVEDSLLQDGFCGVIHLENRSALSLPDVIEAMLENNSAGSSAWPRVSLEEWKSRCLDAAERLSGESAILGKVLFAERASGTAVETMFCHHPLNTDHFERKGRASRLQGLTPPAYWRFLRSRFDQ